MSDSERSIPGHGGHGVLTRFDSERAREAGRKGGAVRRAQAAAKRGAASDLVGAVRELADTFDRADIAPMAFATAAYVMGATLRGEIPIRHAGDAAELLRALVDVGRLESGDPTAAVAIAHLSGPALASRLRDLQAPSAAVQAAADGVVIGPVLDVGSEDDGADDS